MPWAPGARMHARTDGVAGGAALLACTHRVKADLTLVGTSLYTSAAQPPFDLNVVTSST